MAFIVLTKRTHGESVTINTNEIAFVVQELDGSSRIQSTAINEKGVGIAFPVKESYEYVSKLLQSID